VALRPLPAGATAAGTGSLVVVAGPEAATVIDVADGRTAGRLPRRDDDRYRFTLGPDGRYLFAAGPRPGIRQVDLRTGAEQLLFPGVTEAQVAVAPDGTVAAFGTEPGLSVRRPDGTTLAVRGVADRPAFPTAIGISSDGRTVATGDDLGNVSFWHDGSDTLVRAPGRHAGRVLQASFDPSGHYLVTTGDDQVTRVWDSRTAVMVATYPGTGTAAAVSPSGGLLATVRPGGGLQLSTLPLDPERTIARLCTATGRNLTRGEWQTYVGSVPYRATCPDPQFPRPGSPRR
jgi:WD40 repeat protein